MQLATGYLIQRGICQAMFTITPPLAAEYFIYNPIQLTAVYTDSALHPPPNLYKLAFHP